MSSLLFIILLVAAFILVRNWQYISRSLRPPKPKHPAEEISTDEFLMLKPAGFRRISDPTSSFAVEIYSERAAGVIGLINGQSVREEFNHAWAVVSITPGDTVHICKEVAENGAESVLNRLDSQKGHDCTSIISVLKRSAHFRIETTHKAIFSSDRNKTYELRASVLTQERDEYLNAVSQIVASFRINT